MKKNCQILNTNALAEEVACYLADKDDHKHSISYKADSCYLKEDGTFHFVMKDKATGLFTDTRDFAPNELAHMVNMPLCEVVGIDNGGCDELAILFYEEN